jgi:hypothetical protein
MISGIRSSIIHKRPFIQPVSLNRINSCVDIRLDRLRDFHAPILYL